MVTQKSKLAMIIFGIALLQGCTTQGMRKPAFQNGGPPILFKCSNGAVGFTLSFDRISQIPTLIYSDGTSVVLAKDSQTQAAENFVAYRGNVGCQPPVADCNPNAYILLQISNAIFQGNGEVLMGTEVNACTLSGPHPM